jgi:hypothetical protein
VVKAQQNRQWQYKTQSLPKLLSPNKSYCIGLFQKVRTSPSPGDGSEALYKEVSMALQLLVLDEQLHFQGEEYQKDHERFWIWLFS